MCGIAGFIGAGTKDILLSMTATLNRRGPDDSGAYVDGAVHLGHRRLSIIDLSESARQPMSNEDNTIWLVCNGEIYNFQALKKPLVQKGHRFKSKTDSEVIIHLYEEYGTDMFEKLNGMFAFALWDNRQQKLYLARDRMGQKPLYYTNTKGTFIFASDTRAILKHPLFQKTPSMQSLAKFLFYEHVPAPDCIWEDISQLNPASYLVYEPAKQQYTANKYRKLTFLPRLNLTEREYLEILDKKLFQAVQRHLISDVPIGVYLSGGMDSSTIAYYGQKIMGGGLKTFTVAFKEATFGEQYQAREIAKIFHTDHHEIDFSAQDFINTTMECIPNMDAPFSDSSMIPAYFLNKFAKNHIKVALGGEGGDEIFVGYPIYRAHEILNYFRLIPAFLRKSILNPIIRNMYVSYKNETWAYRLKKFIEAEDFYSNPYYCQQIWLGAFGPDRLLKLFKKEFHEDICIDQLFGNIDLYRNDAEEGEGVIDGLMRQTQQKYLMDDGLTKSDRAGMANSVETRAPLLDNELVEWVNRVPFEYKFKNGNTKIILKKLMQNKIPESTIKGQKRGFTPPIAEWFVKYFQKKIKEYIFSSDDCFSQDYIEKLWNEHISGKENHRKTLWTLFVWKLWSSRNLK